VDVGRGVVLVVVVGVVLVLVLVLLLLLLLLLLLVLVVLVVVVRHQKGCLLRWNQKKGCSNKKKVNEIQARTWTTTEVQIKN